MAEEDERESTNTDESTDVSGCGGDAESEVEQALGQMVEGMQVHGQVVEVDRIPAYEVPDGYPAGTPTDDALALHLEVVDAADTTADVYFEWPDGRTDERLEKLLQLRDTSPEGVDELEGETILLTVEAGHFIPVLPKEEPRGDRRGVYGLLAGLGVNLFVAGAAMFNLDGVLVSSTFILLWLAANFVVLPVSAYLDAWSLRTTTNWRARPLFWAGLALIPGLNILVVATYLALRGNAKPL